MVSLTSVSFKCIQTILRDQLPKHLVRDENISENKFNCGFHTGHFRILQLIDVMEDWSQCIEDVESLDPYYMYLS